MPNLNRVFLMGSLTRDPELKYLPKGTAVTQLGLAVNRQWTNEAGEKQEEVTFIDVEMFGRKAEVAAEYLKKGRPVFIEGRLKLDSWDDKATGQKRSKLKVVGEGLEFLGSKDGEQGGQRQQSRPPGKPAAPPQRPPADPDLDPTDDVPF